MARWYSSLSLMMLCALGLAGGQSAAEQPVAKGITLNPNMRPWRLVGSNPDSWFNPNETVRRAMIDQEAALLADLGAGYVRVEFLWWQMEPERGRFDWSVTDYIVAKCREAGLELVPMLVYAPGWAAATPIDPPVDPMGYYQIGRASWRVTV